MSRQPRFIDDDEPIRRRGKHPSRFEEDAADAAVTKPAAPRRSQDEISDDEIDRILREESAHQPAKPAHTGHLDDDATKQFAIDKTVPTEPDDDATRQFEINKIRRYESDGDDGDDDGDDRAPKGGGKKIAMMILAIVLGFMIVGAGVYALVHFVLTPGNTADDTAITETEEPTIPEEPTLTPDPTHPPTEPPTEAPTEADNAALADAYMQKMSARDKMCQLFIVTPEVLTAEPEDAESDTETETDDATAVTLAGDTTKASLKEYPVGGIIYFSANLVDQDQTETMIKNSQSYASTPLFISVDEEGGDVARVAEKLGTKKFKPMFDYKDQGEGVAHDNAEVIGSNLRALGFNMDNAPVADVLSNPDNTVIGDRAYSDDFGQAAKLVASAVKGFADGGVISVLKHFPGHGSTDEDSHEGLAYVNTSVEDLKKNELQPFKSGIEAGADMVMAGHLVVNELDEEMPATLSSKVVPELLRKGLGYDGIVISDSMSMAAITDNYDYETIVKGLFAADIDIILQPDNLDKYIEAMESLLESGDITQAQIDAKVKKILELKYKKGIMTADGTAATEAATTAAATAATDASESTEAAAPTTEPETTDLVQEDPSIAA